MNYTMSKINVYCSKAYKINVLYDLYAAGASFKESGRDEKRFYSFIGS